eukprot:SAG11_NODE_4995_length_1698_cov_5.038774_2_plen_69_part_00
MVGGRGVRRAYGRKGSEKAGTAKRVVRGVGWRVVRQCLTREREKERESKRNEERILFILLFVFVYKRP